jgi:single-strand selective monofunctional uracil DNA glycosylase
VTPPELKARERNLLFTSCDAALVQVIQLLRVELVIGVGKFPQSRAQTALQNAGLGNVRVESILHPSPVNPTANKGWREVVHRQLGELGVLGGILGPT